jgi:hypothetical protein
MKKQFLDNMIVSTLRHLFVVGRYGVDQINKKIVRLVSLYIRT